MNVEIDLSSDLWPTYAVGSTSGNSKRLSPDMVLGNGLGLPSLFDELTGLLQVGVSWRAAMRSPHEARLIVGNFWRGKPWLEESREQVLYVVSWAAIPK